MSNRPYDASYEPRPNDQAREEELRYQRFVSMLVRDGLGSRERAEQAAVTVLCALERRLSGPEAHFLNQELPWALRDLLRSCELDPRARPERYGREALVGRVGEELGVDAAEAVRLVRTVLQTARGLLSAKEASDVASQLPPDLRDLWAPAA